MIYANDHRLSMLLGFVLLGLSSSNTSQLLLVETIDHIWEYHCKQTNSHDDCSYMVVLTMHGSWTPAELSNFRPQTSKNCGRIATADAFSWIAGNTNLGNDENSSTYLFCNGSMLRCNNDLIILYTVTGLRCEVLKGSTRGRCLISRRCWVLPVLKQICTRGHVQLAAIEDAATRVLKTVQVYQLGVNMT